MSSLKIDLNSYVDIATSMVLQDGEFKNVEYYTSKGPKQRVQSSSLTWNEEGFEVNQPEMLKAEWRERIQYWQKSSDKGPLLEDCTSPKELKWDTFFLQHPFAAMSLWNVMQAFYTLDRLCCTTTEPVDKFMDWELMPPFEYLEANKVENSWSNSLRSLRNETKASNNGSALVQRMNLIFFGIKKLENTQEELNRSLGTNLEGVKLVTLMLESIDIAAKKRFSMIDTCLNDDYEIRKEISDTQEQSEKLVESTSNSLAKRIEFTNMGPRIFKPLELTKSIDIVKDHVTGTWISTTKGDATLSAFVIIFLLLVILQNMQSRLITGLDLEMVAT